MHPKMHSCRAGIAALPYPPQTESRNSNRCITQLPISALRIFLQSEVQEKTSSYDKRQQKVNRNPT
jgi:nitric oxide synthase oxygenase domain/subunit